MHRACPPQRKTTTSATSTASAIEGRRAKGREEDNSSSVVHDAPEADDRVHLPWGSVRIRPWHPPGWSSQCQGRARTPIHDADHGEEAHRLRV